MKKALLLLAVCMLTAFNAFAFDPVTPADNCTDAGITNITSPNTNVFTTFGATLTDKPAASAGSNDDDVWFKFTTSTLPVYKIELTGVVDHNPGGFDPFMTIEVWDGCSAEKYVDSTFGNFLMAKHLLPNHTYFIRVYTSGTFQTADFKIAATGLNVPVNDSCETAVTLNAVTACAGGQGPYSTEGATKAWQPSGDFAGSDDDVWFKFTTGTTNLYGKVSILNAVYSGISGNPVIEIWQEKAGQAGVCDSSTQIKFSPFSPNVTMGSLLPNTTYYVRIYTYGTSSFIKSFNLCLALTQVPPDNDTYFTAIPFTINAGASCAASITGGTTKGANADPGGPSCNSGAANDVWYKFEATSTTAHIEITNKVLLPGHASTNSKIWMQVYEGSNTGPATCSGFGALNYDGSTPAQTLKIGTTYYIRLYADDPGNAFTFNICTQAPPPPVYDECGHAVTILPGTDEMCTNSVQLSNVNATKSAEAAPGCFTTIGSDIWLKFTAPDYDNLVVSIPGYEALAGSANPLFGIAVYSGGCGFLTNVKCGLGKSVSLPTLTHGQVYYIRVMAFNAADQGKITVCVHGQAAVAANTTCAAAIPLSIGNETNTIYVHSSTGGVASDNTLTDCGGHAFVFNKALWYKFVASTPNVLVDIQNIIPLNGNTSTLGYKLYKSVSNTCDDIAVQECFSNVKQQNDVITGLLHNKVYYIQVLLNGYNGDDASFNIRVINTQSPHNDEANRADLVIQNPVYKASLSTQGTFRFSTLSAVPDAAVDGTYGGDVWYKFKAATTTATVRVDYNGAPTRVQVYSGAPAGPAVFTAASPNAVNEVTGLTVGNIYYIRVYNPQTVNGTAAGSVFGISVYGTPSTDAAIVAPTGTECVGIDGSFIASTGSQKWLHLTTGGKMVASIFDNVNMGTIQAGYYINAGAVRETPGHVNYLDRNFALSPSIHPSVPVDIIFYFTKAEFDRLTAAPGSHINFLNDLTVAAFNGEACSNSISVSGESDYAISDYGSLSAEVYYIQVSMPHFSGFFLKSGFGVTLPVSCNNFNYNLNEAQVKLSWQTASETNSSRFDVQRSTNGMDYTTMGSVAAAGTTSTPQYYTYTDVTAKAGGTYYYRLKQFDKDGQNRLTCSILKVTTGNAANELFGKAYPNPAVNNVTVNIQKAYSGKVSVQVINSMGQVVSQKSIEVTNSLGQINITTSQLPSGSYTIRLITREAVYTKQFSKMK